MTDLSRLPLGTHTLPSGVVVTVSGPARLPQGTKRPDLGDKFEAIWKVWGDPAFPMVREFRFDESRKWRFDAAWPEPHLKVACEFDGGVHTGGRHTRGKGFEKDAEKLNAAASQGWLVLRFTSRDLQKRRQADTVRQVIEVLRERAK